MTTDPRNCTACDHRLASHRRQASGAYRCTSSGCGCEVDKMGEPAVTLDNRLSQAQLKLRNGHDDDLSRAVAEARDLLKELFATLEAAQEHLEYCSYGDQWERVCARSVKLPERIETVLAKRTK